MQPPIASDLFSPFFFFPSGVKTPGYYPSWITEASKRLRCFNDLWCLENILAIETKLKEVFVSQREKHSRLFFHAVINESIYCLLLLLIYFIIILSRLSIYCYNCFTGERFYIMKTTLQKPFEYTNAKRDVSNYAALSFSFSLFSCVNEHKWKSNEICNASWPSTHHAKWQSYSL